ncbi:lipoxygenase [Mycena epipterygia]|nr:lipoxygenase [Mycena epipterygia]
MLLQSFVFISTSYAVQAAVFPRQTVSPYTIPLGAAASAARAEAISATRVNFTYGPDIAGNGPFYPTGPLGDEVTQAMTDDFFGLQLPWTAAVTSDAGTAAQNVVAAGGLNTFDDYKKLYNSGNWESTMPSGVVSGALTNGSSDLLFAMERLSIQPYSIRRINASETLSFTVDDATAKNLTTLTHAALQKAGRLFYIDYRRLAEQPLIEGRYAAAADAFFFLHPISDDFLPLAIRANNGSPLIYTPLDTANDWQLAKMLFAQNDIWWGEWYHLVATHEVIDLVYAAAYRTLSTDHPILALMGRLAYQTWAFRVSAIKTLVNDGGPVDELFSWRGSTASNFSDTLYYETAGKWQSNYFTTHLAARGLINSKFGPALKSFPFFEDASVVTDAIRTFMTTTVNAYYPNPGMVRADQELQNFIAEAVPAEIFDFPTSLTTNSGLVDIMTHFAYLVSVLHSVMNSNEVVRAQLVLPYHPVAIYAPLPQTKGVQDLAPFLPALDSAVGQILLGGAFNRPNFIANKTYVTLDEMFSEPTLLSRLNAPTQKAAGVFKSAMQAFSKVVSGRTFDAEGLSQGMPILWTILDPLTTPFCLSV